MTILITGGAGYIGSHTTLAFLQQGYEVVVLDNLVNSSFESIKRIERIAGKSPAFVHGDVRDQRKLRQLFTSYPFSAVIHLAGLKAVAESIFAPLSYYDNNVSGTLSLCQVMGEAGVRKLIFSSSATVYGEAASVPITEAEPTGRPNSPYGRSKLMVEEVLRDLGAAESDWSIALLRYFNPVGAHDSGLIGEDPKGIPNNLLPYISQVAVGKLKELSVFGDDYPTPDGTGVRDYIHVLDLADGHVKAMQALGNRPGTHAWNLGTGEGHSVMEIIRVFESISGKKVPFQVRPRRSGDIAISFADPRLAERELGWKAKRGLEEMIRDAWRWQSRNPEGYR